MRLLRLFFARKEQGQDHRSRDGHGNDAQGEEHRHLEEVDDEHLGADEDQDEGETVLEEVEAVHDAGQQEVERPQTEDGEDVAGEDQERVGGDGKDGRDGVDGEDQVGDFDQKQDEEEWSGVPNQLAAALERGLLHEEAVFVILVGDRHQLAEPLQEPVVFSLDRSFVVLEGHLGAGEEQDGAEDVHHEVELFHQIGAGCDHGSAHGKGAENAPEEHSVLILERHCEGAEEQHEDEDVVDREGFLDQIAGEEFDRRLGAHGVVDDAVEGESQRDPDRAPGDCFLERRLVRLTVEDAQIEGQHEGDERAEAAPEPQLSGFHVFYP